MTIWRDIHPGHHPRHYLGRLEQLLHYYTQNAHFMPFLQMARASS